MQHPDNGILFSTKKQQATSHEKIWRKIKCLCLSEITQSEKAIGCVLSTIGYSRRVKTTDSVKRSVFARGEGGGGGMTRWNTEDF